MILFNFIQIIKVVMIYVILPKKLKFFFKKNPFFFKHLNAFTMIIFLKIIIIKAPTTTIITKLILNKCLFFYNF